MKYKVRAYQGGKHYPYRRDLSPAEITALFRKVGWL